MTNDDYSLRPATVADAPALTAIAHAAKRHWGYPEEWIRRWADGLTLTPAYIGQNLVFIAREGETIRGFHALVLQGNDAQLDHLWVLPDAMGQGIGRALFEHAENCARQNGATRLWVESDPHAESFYRHLGMTVFDQTPAPMDGQPRFLPLLEKVL
jgi:GNAT superfamily N-acetyltransferase